MSAKLDKNYSPNTVISYWDKLVHDIQGIILTQLVKLQVKDYEVYYKR